jgi:hypothetical protein
MQMPYFYFDFFHHQQSVPDNVGGELANLDAAKAEAVAASAEWLKDNASIAGTEVTVTILDDDRYPLYSVTAAVVVKAIGQSAADRQLKGTETGLLSRRAPAEFSGVVAKN